jgi:hypothetical protein
VHVYLHCIFIDVFTLAIPDGTVKPVEDNTTLGKYWKAVKENTSDFTGWTYLLQYVEQEVV